MGHDREEISECRKVPLGCYQGGFEGFYGSIRIWLGSIRGCSQVVGLALYHLCRVFQMESSSITVGVVQKELCLLRCRTLFRLSQLQLVN